jgi:hypothetical protein
MAIQPCVCATVLSLHEAQQHTRGLLPGPSTCTHQLRRDIHTNVLMYNDPRVTAEGSPLLVPRLTIPIAAAETTTRQPHQSAVAIKQETLEPSPLATVAVGRYIIDMPAQREQGPTW